MSPGLCVFTTFTSHESTSLVLLSSSGGNWLGLLNERKNRRLLPQRVLSRLGNSYRKGTNCTKRSEGEINGSMLFCVLFLLRVFPHSYAGTILPISPRTSFSGPSVHRLSRDWSHVRRPSETYHVIRLRTCNSNPFGPVVEETVHTPSPSSPDVSDVITGFRHLLFMCPLHSILRLSRM